MKHVIPSTVLLSLVISAGSAFGQTTAARPNAAPATAARKASPDATLALQVALDRAGFSPGAIDGKSGSNTENALRAFQRSNGLTPTGEADSATAERLGPTFQTPLTTYDVTAEDVAGPFSPSIPADMMKKAELKVLGYTSIQEMLAERFHVKQEFLQQLNATSQFKQGDTIKVPNVEPTLPASKSATSPSASAADRSGNAGAATDAARANTTKPAPGDKPARANNAPVKNDLVVTVTDATKSLTVEDASGKVIFFAPVTVGSKNDPLPVGEWKVNGVDRNPAFNYNPDLFWDANPAHSKAKLAPGPNNPVGAVWIDLSKEHYGIHGTPEPSRIGYTESHGCIRLTNWDALRLAALVAPGTKVILR